MRILYLRSGPYEPSEKNYNLQEIGMLSEFCRMGHDCDLFYYGKKNRHKEIFFQNEKKLNIFWIKGLRILRSGVYPKLLSRKLLRKYDMIICSEYSQMMTVLLSHLHPNVYCYNGPYYNLFKIKCLERVYDFLFISSLKKNIRCFFCKSDLSKKYLESKGISNTVVTGVGQNMEKFNLEQNDMLESTARLLKKIDKNTLLYVGSIEDRKNFPFLLNIMEIIAKKKPEVRLLIIGDGKQKYISSNLNKVDSEVLDRIQIEKFIQNDQLKYIYPKVRGLLLPSKLEIFGMVILEAMSMGTPVISSMNGGSSTLINSYSNSIIADIKNIDEWIVAIEVLFDDSDYYRMSLEAKKSITDHYTWKSIVEKMLTEVEGCARRE